MSKQVIQMRADLFLRFTKQFLSASTVLSFSGKVANDSILEHLLANKNLALDSVKDAIFDKKVY